MAASKRYEKVSQSIHNKLLKLFFGFFHSHSLCVIWIWKKCMFLFGTQKVLLKNRKSLIKFCYLQSAAPACDEYPDSDDECPLLPLLPCELLPADDAPEALDTPLDELAERPEIVFVNPPNELPNA
jgi:hypothetical protein